MQEPETPAGPAIPQDDAPNALAECRRRLRECPDSTELLLRLGRLCLTLGHTAESCRSYLKALDTDPDSEEARRGLEEAGRRHFLSAAGAAAPRQEGAAAPLLSGPAASQALHDRLARVKWQSRAGSYGEELLSVACKSRAAAPMGSVVIVAHRHHPGVLEALRVLRGQLQGHSAELVYVLNGPEADLPAEQKGIADKVLRLRRNVGAFKSRNIGAAFADGAVLIFLDDDAIPSDNFIGKHLQIHAAHRAVCAVRGRCYPLTYGSEAAVAPHYDLGEEPIPYYLNLEGNLSAKADRFFQVGGFDDMIFYGGGGAELSYRLKRMAGEEEPTWYFPEPAIYHDYATDPEARRRKQQTQSTSHEQIAQRHKDFGRYLRYYRRRPDQRAATPPAEARPELSGPPRPGRLLPGAPPRPKAPSPTEGDRLRDEARALQAGGDLQQAYARYLDAVDCEPWRPELLVSLATTCFELGKMAECERHLVRAALLDAQCGDAQSHLELLCRSQGTSVETLKARAGMGGPAAKAAPLLDISVVVPVGGRFEAFDECLRALSRQQFSRPAFEVLAVPNGVRDGRRAQLAGLLSRWQGVFGPRLRTYWLEESSIPTARNTGIEHAGGRIILQINADTVLCDDALALHYQDHQDFQFDPRFVLVGGRRFPDGYRDSFLNYLHERLGLGMPLHAPMPRFTGDHHWLVTCNMSCSRETYARFGAYNPAYHWGSDTELGKRWANEEGLWIFVNTKIVSYHLHRLSLDAWRSNWQARAPFACMLAAGCLPQRLGPGDRLSVREQIERADIDMARLEEDLRRVERSYRSPADLAGQSVLGERFASAEEFERWFRPVLAKYKDLLQRREISRLAQEAEAREKALPQGQAPAVAISVCPPGPSAAAGTDDAGLKAQAEALYEKGDPEGALALYLTLLERRPHDPSVLNDLGTVTFALGRVEESIGYLVRALGADPDCPEARQNLASVCSATGRRPEEVTERLRRPDTPASDSVAGGGPDASGTSWPQAKRWAERLLAEGDGRQAFRLVLAFRTWKSSEEAAAFIRERLASVPVRISFVMDSGIGNMIMATPALRAIRRLLPESELEVVGTRPALDVLAGWDVVGARTEVDAFDPEGDRDALVLSTWWKRFREMHPGALKGARCPVVACRYGRGGQHEAESHLTAARILGYAGDLPEPYCAVAEVASPFEGSGTIALIADTSHPAQHWQKKRWPHYRELARRLLDCGYQVGLIGGEVEAKSFVAGEWPDGVVNLLGKYSIGQTAHLIREAGLLVTNDSGPAHIGGAVGARTCVIFGPTLEAKNRPMGPNVAVISAGLPCSPCQYTQRWQECTETRCMAEVDVDDVMFSLAAADGGAECGPGDADASRANLGYWTERYRRVGPRRTVGGIRWDRATYERENEAFIRRMEGVLDGIVGGGKVARLLDFGCGSGRFTDFLLRYAERYYGTDIVDDVIRYDRARFGGKADAAFAVLRGSRIPFEGNEFDVIWSCVVLQHVVDDELLRECGRQFCDRLKEAGALVLIENVSSADSKGYIKFRSIEDYRRLLPQFDLQHVGTHLFDGEPHAILVGRKAEAASRDGGLDRQCASLQEGALGNGAAAQAGPTLTRLLAQTNEVYQDIEVGDAVLVKGKRDCSERWGLMRDHLPQSGVVLDVGSNLGYYTRKLARERPDLLVVSFEPVPAYVAVQLHLLKMEQLYNVVLCQNRLSLPLIRAWAGTTDLVDGVLALSVLHHYAPDDALGVLTELARFAHTLILEMPPPDEKEATGGATVRALSPFERTLRGVCGDDADIRLLGDAASHTATGRRRELWCVNHAIRRERLTAFLGRDRRKHSLCWDGEWSMRSYLGDGVGPRHRERRGAQLVPGINAWNLLFFGVVWPPAGWWASAAHSAYQSILSRHGTVSDVRPWNLIRTPTGMAAIDWEGPADWTTEFTPGDLERTCECFRRMAPLQIDWRDRKAG